MRRHKVLLTAIMLLIALVPTYLIIYQSIVATGLPDFDKQTKVEIVFPPTTQTSNRKTVIYTKDSEEYLALTTVLTKISDVSSLPQDVSTDVSYEIIFSAKDGGKSICYLYASHAELAFYLETPQGKYFRLDLPLATYGSETLSPLAIGYYIASKDDAPESLSANPNPTEIPLSSLSALTDIHFESTPWRVQISVYADGDVLLGRYDGLSGFPNHENAKYVNITVDFKLTENVVCRTAYRVVLS